MHEARHLTRPSGAPLWVKITAWVVSVALIAVLGFAGYWYFRLQGNLNTAPLTASGRDKGGLNDATDRLQILIMGTDTRDGKNKAYGTSDQSSGYGNSDVMMLLDISADNQRVSMVSFPRDLVVSIPQCIDPKTKQVKAPRPNAQINSAMSEAGPGCTVDTINKLTGLEIDHFMMADFNAVKELSNEVGGVEVCVNAPIDDPDSRLKLPAGKSLVQGDQALAFLRNRHGVGDGSDITRIKSQQQFLASLARKVRSDGTLTNIPKLLGIADTVTKNLTVDEGLANPQTLITIAQRLQKVDLAKVAFVTVPWEPSDVNPTAWVQPKEPDAGQLFKAMREGVDLTNPNPPKPKPKPSATPSSTPTPTPTATKKAVPAVDQSTAPVTVANATGIEGRSQELNTFLLAKGFLVQEAVPADTNAKTVVYYSSAYRGAAVNVATALGIPQAQLKPSADILGVQVVVGTDFTTGTAYQVIQLPKDIVGQTAADQTCQTAFSG
ncbi:LCP family protein required for cell wall assembly [Arthrobacter woluwensis]|uniref:LCP family protein n=1 Tax=Arthrobacter woluwensis TaxID=156980 RepID=UPI002789BB3A|nr:LCP family protein [Arthrobacter woluwensis]MDQ0708693.1 LCP family protein required for cell wall assembly [Arthrobacter woluwensis]